MEEHLAGAQEAAGHAGRLHAGTVPPSAGALYAEAQWEHAGIDRAAERYRQSAGLRPAASTASGQWLLKQIVGKLVPAIETAQAAALKALMTGGGSKPSPGALPLTALPAGALAAITATVAFSAVRASRSLIPMVALNVASMARDEIEYRNWIAEQKAANKAARKEGDCEHTDLLAKFKRTYPNVLQRTWAVWRRKVDALREEKWPDKVGVYFGSELLDILCHVAPEHFSTVLRRSGAKTARHLVLSPETVELLSDIEARAAVARPMMMPMIIPPVPWVYRWLSGATTHSGNSYWSSCPKNIRPALMGVTFATSGRLFNPPARLH